MPFPRRRAAAHSVRKASQDIVAPVGVIRTSKPSPVTMGCERLGQVPRRRGAFMMPPRSQRSPSPRRRHYAGDARTLARAPRRGESRWPPQPRDSPDGGKSELHRRRHRRRTRDRTSGWARLRSSRRNRPARHRRSAARYWAAPGRLPAIVARWRRAGAQSLLHLDNRIESHTAIT